MKTCSLDGFMKELTPWLTKDYIREIYFNDNEDVVVEFLDATRHVYRIDDCTAAHVRQVMEDLKTKGIKVTL
jgi:hypothetical protein